MIELADISGFESLCAGSYSSPGAFNKTGEVSVQNVMCDVGNALDILNGKSQTVNQFVAYLAGLRGKMNHADYSALLSGIESFTAGVPYGVLDLRNLEHILTSMPSCPLSQNPHNARQYMDSAGTMIIDLDNLTSSGGSGGSGGGSGSGGSGSGSGGGSGISISGRRLGMGERLSRGFNRNRTAVVERNQQLLSRNGYRLEDYNGFYSWVRRDNGNNVISAYDQEGGLMEGSPLSGIVDPDTVNEGGFGQRLASGLGEMFFGRRVTR